MTTQDTIKPDNAPEALKTQPGECSGGSHCSAYISDSEARALAARMLPKPDPDTMEQYAKDWIGMNRTKIARALLARFPEDRLTRAEMLQGIKDWAAQQWPDERIPMWAQRVGAHYDTRRRKWFLPNAKSSHGEAVG